MQNYDFFFLKMQFQMASQVMPPAELKLVSLPVVSLLSLAISTYPS